jgi:hypothetical protein
MFSLQPPSGALYAATRNDISKQHRIGISKEVTALHCKRNEVNTMVKFTTTRSFMCGPTMTSSFRERNPELKKNTRRKGGNETDKKQKMIWRERTCI